MSVVMPALDAAAWIDGQLAALAAQEVPVPWEVVVADNGSTDDTAARAASWSDRLPVRVIDASARRGINHARNRGAAEALGTLLLYCDADDIVHPGWVAAFWRARDHWDVAGGQVDGATLNDEAALRRHPDGNVSRGLATFGWLPTFMGCNFAVHRAVHTKLDGFDESFVEGCDDIEFAFRAQLAGLRQGFVPDAVVAYRLRGSLRDAVRQFYRYGHSRPHLYRKFRASGMPRRSLRHAVRTYALTLWHVPHLITADGRGRWTVQAAFLVGMLTGSVHDHTLYLSE
ncbi:MAG TPA: glycosyltransferase [Acidimicrobiales bacterium]|nr:glycosyltransferase [Acidimicrobiales bacterium]